MKRTIQLTRYISILALTILIFSTGILIGSAVETERINFLVEELQEQDISYQNLVAEQNYIEYLLVKKKNTDVDCQTIEAVYKKSIVNLDLSIAKLTLYQNSADVDNDAFKRIKKQYAHAQLTYWTLGQQLKTTCEIEYDTILFFYDDKDVCPECEDQGLYLDYVKKKLGQNVGIFSFDRNLEGPVGLIKTTYNISQTPSPVIIINEDVLGFSTHDDIFAHMCEKNVMIPELGCK